MPSNHAHELLGRYPDFPQPERSTATTSAPWSTSIHLHQDRSVLIIIGAPSNDKDLVRFKNEIAIITDLAKTRLGVPVDNIKVCQQPSVSEVELAMADLSKNKGQCLVYYTGHGLIDEKGYSATKEGIVSIDDYNQYIADHGGIPKGNASAPKGAEQGALLLRTPRIGANYTVVLNERRLKEILSRYSAEFEKGITLLLDTCHSGAFITQAKDSKKNDAIALNELSLPSRPKVG